jgi:hypothetical protein
MNRLTASNTVRVGVVVLAILSSVVFYIVLLRQYGALPTVRENNRILREQQMEINRIGMVQDSLVASLRPWRIPWAAKSAK